MKSSGPGGFSFGKLLTIDLISLMNIDPFQRSMSWVSSPCGRKPLAQRCGGGVPLAMGAVMISLRFEKQLPVWQKQQLPWQARFVT